MSWLLAVLMTAMVATLDRPTEVQGRCSCSICEVDQPKGLIDLTEVRRQVNDECPLYQLVPKTLNENLEWRKRMIRWGAADKANAKTLWTACRRDLLFYINTFVWTFDNRDIDNPRLLPFITYPFQDEVFLALHEALGRHDLLIEKSRDMGASWMSVTIFEWRWHFYDYVSFLLVSRNEAMVDKTEDPKSLMWKIDCIHRNLPGWLMPNMERSNLHFLNCDTHSTIDGESTTGFVGTGDRRTAILLDEFACVEDGYKVLPSTRDTTRCRFFNSTPKGIGNAYYDQRQKGTPRIRLHWPIHPLKSAESYTDASGAVRSPWYDGECERAALESEIAQELDIDYMGSGFPFFKATMLDKCMEDACPPYLRGELHFDPISYEPSHFTESPFGRLWLWIHPDAAGELPSDRRFVLGADIGLGAGASNSVASIGDCMTGEKVAEFADPSIDAQEFAGMTVALAKWFKGDEAEGAYLIWEANGPGGLFGKEIIKSGYRNIYYRTKEDKISKPSKDTFGWWSAPKEKDTLLGEYALALRTGRTINRSIPALDECRMYVWAANGHVVHDKAAKSVDPSGARENHGDRVIADAVMTRGMEDIPKRAGPVEPAIPIGSFGWRQKERQLAAVVLEEDRW